MAINHHTLIKSQTNEVPLSPKRPVPEHLRGRPDSHIASMSDKQAGARPLSALQTIRITLKSI